MGEVYRAHDARLDRTVAIKVLPASFSADRDRLQRFAQEAREKILRGVNVLAHPGLLRGDSLAGQWIAIQIGES